MILECARIRVAPGRERDFEAGVAEAAPLFRRARGCRDMALHRVEEDPSLYVLMVEWETLEDHVVHFRQSEDFQTWRALVGPCFAEPPVVEHHSVIDRFFGQGVSG
jgi:heme-degrading monooxygenase HmoA